MNNIQNNMPVAAPNMGATNGLAKIDVSELGIIYAKSSNWLDVYSDRFEKLKERITEPKLSTELDNALIDFDNSAMKAHKAMSDARMPITRRLDEVKSNFTLLENSLKAIRDEVRSIRNKSAAIYAKEAEEKRLQAEREAMAERQKVLDRTRMEGELRLGYAAILEEYKSDLLTAFEGMDLENHAKVQSLFENVDIKSLPKERWDAVHVAPSPFVELESVKTAELYDVCSKHFVEEVNKYAKFLLESIPDRLEEIKRGAESALMEKQAEEKARLAKEAEEKAKQAEAAELAKVELQTAVAQANIEAETPKVITSSKIEVLSVDGWRAIIDYYLVNSGVAFDKLETTRLSSMRVFAERQAKATGELIDHASVKYVNTYKASTKRAKV